MTASPKELLLNSNEGSPSDKYNVRGGWLPSLTLSSDIIGICAHLMMLNDDDAEFSIHESAAPRRCSESNACDSTPSALVIF